MKSRRRKEPRNVAWEQKAKRLQDCQRQDITFRGGRIEKAVVTLRKGEEWAQATSGFKTKEKAKNLKYSAMNHNSE